jgi:hypothetical protein
MVDLRRHFAATPDKITRRARAGCEPAAGAAETAGLHNHSPGSALNPRPAMLQAWKAWLSSLQRRAANFPRKIFWDFLQYLGGGQK